jgi:hypothetical protein
LATELRKQVAASVGKRLINAIVWNTTSFVPCKEKVTAAGEVPNMSMTGTAVDSEPNKSARYAGVSRDHHGCSTSDFSTPFFNWS